MLAGCAKPAEETGAVPGAALPDSTGTVPVESEVFEPSQQVFGSSSIDTGNLSEEGNGYEGIEGIQSLPLHLFSHLYECQEVGTCVAQGIIL